jgi:integrase/recombinase XerD
MSVVFYLIVRRYSMRSRKVKTSKLLTEYISFLRDYQCLSEETIIIRRHFVKPFLIHIKDIAQPSKIYKLSAKIIHDYIIITARPLHRASKKHLTSTIRSFLRFAYIKGYLKRDLKEAVPIIITWKLDRLPQFISWENVQNLLTMPDKTTQGGRRDLAILLLLATYGLRIGQITTLKLKDIHWREGVICFPGTKHSNSLRLPLYKEVAAALLVYIKKDRGKAEFEEVFLTIRKPIRPLGKRNHYNREIQKYYVKAGIDSTCRGTRIIRHAFATQLMNKNTPIKIISDLLGHKSIGTTFIYTKVDVEKLRELARNWPEV